MGERRSVDDVLRAFLHRKRRLVRRVNRLEKEYLRARKEWLSLDRDQALRDFWNQEADKEDFPWRALKRKVQSLYYWDTNVLKDSGIVYVGDLASLTDQKVIDIIYSDRCSQIFSKDEILLRVKGKLYYKYHLTTGLQIPGWDEVRSTL